MRPQKYNSVLYVLFFFVLNVHKQFYQNRQFVILVFALN